MDASDRDTIELEWASHGEEARCELLQENNSLTLESANQKDEHSTGSDTFSKLSGFRLESLGDFFKYNGQERLVPSRKC